MLMRLRLLLGSAAGAALLLLVLCLGSQNLSTRLKLNLGLGQTAPLPSGFVVGVAVVMGVVSGGWVTALMLPVVDQEPGRE